MGLHPVERSVPRTGPRDIANVGERGIKRKRQSYQDQRDRRRRLSLVKVFRGQTDEQGEDTERRDQKTIVVNLGGREDRHHDDGKKQERTPLPPFSQRGKHSHQKEQDAKSPKCLAKSTLRMPQVDPKRP